MKNSLRNKNKIRRPKEEGYSLLEILVVLAVISLLATLVAPRLFSHVDKSKVTTAKAQMKSLRLALDSYKLDVGHYPNQQQGLNILVTAPSDGSIWYGPYLDGEVPLDPWGKTYIYKPATRNTHGQELPPKISSFGADGELGGNGIDADIES